MRVALINTNRIQPPIAPIGLDYVCEALAAADHEPLLLDLCWEDDWRCAIGEFFGRHDVGVVGLSLRNTDDCMYPSRASFVQPFCDMVAAVRQTTSAVTVLGGAGFSVMPETLLALSGADAGIWGDGEASLPLLADGIEGGQDWHQVPGLVCRGDDGTFLRTSADPFPLDRLPPMGRRFVDNRRYFDLGGQAGFETKRGCPMPCSYCADPVAKGRVLRLRPPGAVVDELENLVDQGIDHLHTCDSEFNIPRHHAIEVCEAIIARGLPGRLRWYAYCAPSPFSPELAILMARAGCVGVNFGTDHADPAMLKRLGRNYTIQDVRAVTRWCREQGMAVMLDLLIGSPGETEASLTTAIREMAATGADRIGVSYGARVYPGTPMAASIDLHKGTIGTDDPRDPRFYIDPAVAEHGPALITRLIGGDQRFFFENPDDRSESSHNYNEHGPLQRALAAGYRGAYWDVLRRWVDAGPDDGSLIDS